MTMTGILQSDVIDNDAMMIILKGLDEPNQRHLRAFRRCHRGSFGRGIRRERLIL